MHKHIEALGTAQLRIRPELGKSKAERRGRWVPIAPALVEELSGWGRREGFVIPCPREHREARARDAARAWRRAGVDPGRWEGSAHHAFRAGFQSGLKQLGADDEVVEFLVGHSRGIREHYVSPEALPLVAAVQLVPPVGVCTPGVQRIPLAARRQGQGQQSGGWRRTMGIEPTERNLSARPDRF